MQLAFALDEFGRLKCDLSDGGAPVKVSASNMPAAADDLLRVVSEAETKGAGDCWWLEGAGEFRWVVRREGAQATLVVLWSAGTLTGWEHVFWAQGDFDSLASSIRHGLANLAVQAG